MVTWVLDEDEIEDDTMMVSLQRRRRKTPAAQPAETEGLFREFEMVENAEYLFQALVFTSDQKGSASNAPSNFYFNIISYLAIGPLEQEQDVCSPGSPDQGNIEMPSWPPYGILMVSAVLPFLFWIRVTCFSSRWG